MTSVYRRGREPPSSDNPRHLDNSALVVKLQSGPGALFGVINRDIGVNGGLGSGEESP